MRICQFCGIELKKKFKRGNPYFVCPKCGRKSEREFSYRLEDRPGMKKIFADLEKMTKS